MLEKSPENLQIQEKCHVKNMTKEVAYYNYTPATHDNSDKGKHIE